MDSRSITLVGIALILLGIVAFTDPWGGASRDNRIATGSSQAAVDARNPSLLSPTIGGLVLVAGVLLVAVGAKKSSQ